MGVNMMIANNETSNINETIKRAESITIFKGGKLTEIKKNDEKFNKILNNITDCFFNSRIMPALGVSLDEEMREELKTGNWIQLNFNKTEIVNELPFEALLFRLDECYGLNLIRETKGKYQGRCFYLDLDERTDLLKIID